MLSSLNKILWLAVFLGLTSISACGRTGNSTQLSDDKQAEEKASIAIIKRALLLETFVTRSIFVDGEAKFRRQTPGDLLEIKSASSTALGTSRVEAVSLDASGFSASSIVGGYDVIAEEGKLYVLIRNGVNIKYVKGEEVNTASIIYKLEASMSEGKKAVKHLMLVNKDMPRLILEIKDKKP